MIRLVADFDERLKEEFGPALRDTELSGGLTKGMAREGSAVQVLVLLDHAGFTERQRVLDVVGDLLAETGQLISARVFDPASYGSHLAPRASARLRQHGGEALTVTSPARRRAVEVELEAANEELASAQLLVEAERFRVGLCRLYLAVFRAARAMLYAQGFEPASHRKALMQFSASLIRTGHCDRSHARLLSRLHGFHSSANEGEAPEPELRDAARELREAAAFIEHARCFSTPRQASFVDDD